MKTKLLSLCLALICATQLFAYDCQIDGICYNLNNTNLTAVVTKGFQRYSGAISIPASITYNSQTYSVTTIGVYAFQDCRGLTSITIPNSVTTMGGCAFSNCSSLTKTNYTGTIADWCKIKCDASSNPVCWSHNFYINNIEIKDLVIPDGVDAIGEYTFYDCTGLTSVTIPNSVVSIGLYAFAECTKLVNVTLGAGLTTIGDKAFYNDYRIETITSYAATITPEVGIDAFYNVSKQYVYLYVSGDSQRKYQVDPNWNGFDIHVIGAENTSSDNSQVIVVPTANDATFTWPADDQAAEYSIEITKDGVVFCILKFNAIGQLASIASVPGRGHTAMAHAATSANAGWQFTVTGLKQASKYAYTLDVTDAQKQSIKTYTGEFATDGYTDLLPLPYEGKDGIGSVKFIKNGRLLIERNSIRYDAHGARVK